MVKPIRVDSDEEFELLRDKIDRETSDAHHHWTLLKELNAAHNEYWREFNESNTFWYLTRIAHQDAILAHLGRLYDEHTGALSLARFLETVRANRALFSDEAFKKRLGRNPHKDTLAPNRVIHQVELDAEIESVSKSDPLVKELHSLRNEVLAHTSADVIRKGQESNMRWLSGDGVSTLLQRASDITVKYSLFYRASCYGSIAGSGDFMNTLKWVRKALVAMTPKSKRTSNDSLSRAVL